MIGIGEFHHVGLACRAIDAEIAGLTALGYQQETPIYTDPRQMVRVQFFVGPGPRIELVEPTSPTSPAQGYINRRTKLYHFAYFVPDIDAAIATLEQQDFRLTGPATPAVAFDMRSIAFLFSPTLFLVELIEAPRSTAALISK